MATNAAATKPDFETVSVANDITYKKIFTRILCMLTLFLVISYIDRVNVGFAKLRMMTDLKFDDSVYGLGAGLFFITYSLLQAPSNWVIHRFGARITVSFLMMAWSVSTVAFFFVQTRWQFYGLRLILGAAEAGFYPGMLLYLTYWFPARWRGKAGAAFIMAVPLSGIIGGPLSGWLLGNFDGIHGYAGWRWMFLIEGAISLGFGVLAWLIMPDGVRDAKWLTGTEKDSVAGELALEEANIKRCSESVSGWSLLTSSLLWKMTAVIFCGAIGLNALTFWLPTLVSETGVHSPFHVGLLTTIPYLFACACMVLVGKSSDKHLERRYHIAVPFIFAAAALALSTQYQTNLPMSILLLSIAAGGILTVLPIFWTLPSTVLTGKRLAIGIGLINMVANSAGFISPYMIGWLRNTTHSSVGAAVVLSCGMLVGAAFVLTIPKRRV